MTHYVIKYTEENRLCKYLDGFSLAVEVLSYLRGLRVRKSSKSSTIIETSIVEIFYFSKQFESILMIHQVFKYHVQMR